MPKIQIPTNLRLHNSRHFLAQLDFFEGLDVDEVEMRLPERWMNVDPFGLVTLAGWAQWQRNRGRRVIVSNLQTGNYAWRMGFFEFVDTQYEPGRIQHEEAGRFMPLRNVSTSLEIRAAVADISALLHLEENPDSLAAVQYCVSELLRNVLEHSNSPTGAIICAQNYPYANPRRVVIGVADCGIGIREHLGRVYGDALRDDAVALDLAMQPGITGAVAGLYGTPDNAGAGLFITRSIAKGTGGYYVLTSGRASYRLLRASNQDAQAELFIEPLADRHDTWDNPHPWPGTLVAMEIRTDQIESFEDYFAWIRRYVPPRTERGRQIRFT